MHASAILIVPSFTINMLIANTLAADDASAFSSVLHIAMTLLLRIHTQLHGKFYILKKLSNLL
jgi:hypothetical protein